MYADSVKRKLIVHPKDRPWSSWSHYAKGEKGLSGLTPSKRRRAEDEMERIQKEKSKTAPLKAKGAAPSTQNRVRHQSCATRPSGPLTLFVLTASHLSVRNGDVNLR
jgi:hypothetical protein